MFSFEKMCLIESIKQMTNELENTKKISLQIKNSLKDLQLRSEQLEKDLEAGQKNLENYKKSKEHLEFLEEQKNIEQANIMLNTEIIKLKQELNFRLLLKYFHNDQKKSKIIKNYSENFLDALKQDENLEIIELIKQANSEISGDKIKKIKQAIAEQKIPSESKKHQDLELK